MAETARVARPERGPSQALTRDATGRSAALAAGSTVLAVYWAVPPTPCLRARRERTIGVCVEGERVTGSLQVADPDGERDAVERGEIGPRPRDRSDAPVRVGVVEDPGELPLPGPRDLVVDAEERAQPLDGDERLGAPEDSRAREPAGGELRQDHGDVGSRRERPANRVTEPLLELDAVQQARLAVVRGELGQPELPPVPGRDVANGDEALRAAGLVGDGAPRRDHPDASSVAMPERELAVHLAARLELGVPCLDLVPVLGRPERVRGHRAEELVLVEPDQLAERSIDGPNAIRRGRRTARRESPRAAFARHPTRRAGARRPSRHRARSQSANAVARPRVSAAAVAMRTPRSDGAASRSERTARTTPETETASRSA